MRIRRPAASFPARAGVERFVSRGGKGKSGGYRTITFYSGESLPVFAQELACTWAGWQRSRRRYTPHFHRTLAELERTAAAPVDALHAIQWQRLRRLVEHARRNVPYYASLPPPADLPEPLAAIRATLAAIPPLAKSTYRDRTEEFIARNLDRRSLLKGKTSGTTGSALPLWHTREQLAEEFATFWRMRRTAGVDLFDANLTFNGQTIVPFAQTRPPFWRALRAVSWRSSAAWSWPRRHGAPWPRSVLAKCASRSASWRRDAPKMRPMTLSCSAARSRGLRMNCSTS